MTHQTTPPKLTTSKTLARDWVLHALGSEYQLLELTPTHITVIKHQVSAEHSHANDLPTVVTKFSLIEDIDSQSYLVMLDKGWTR